MAVLEPEWKYPLLRRARAAIARAIGIDRGADGFVIPDSIPMDLHAGAFVTLRINGHLRGCIGYPEPDQPLLAARRPRAFAHDVVVGTRALESVEPPGPIRT